MMMDGKNGFQRNIYLFNLNNHENQSTYRNCCIHSRSNGAVQTKYVRGYNQYAVCAYPPLRCYCYVYFIIPCTMIKLTSDNVYQITRKWPRNFLVKYRTNDEKSWKKAEMDYVDIETQHDAMDAKKLSQELRSWFKIRDYGNWWKRNAPITPSFLHSL